MPEKKNMLIRAIPMDIWERVDMLCRRRGIKRREFLEQALSYFEGGEDRQGYEQEAEKARQAKMQVDQIMQTIKTYKDIIDFKKKIEYVRKNIGIMGSQDTEMNMLLELKTLEEDLDNIIKEYIPKHEIPEDPEELRKMGLKEYSYVDIPLTYKRKGLEPQPFNPETEFEGSYDDLSKRLREIQDEIKKEQEEVHSENEEQKETQEDDVKTYVFGRGFEETDENKQD